MSVMVALWKDWKGDEKNGEGRRLCRIFHTEESLLSVYTEIYSNLDRAPESVVERLNPEVDLMPRYAFVSSSEYLLVITKSGTPAAQKLF